MSSATDDRPATVGAAIARAHEAFVFGSDEARAAKCPTCDADPGLTCRTKAGKATSSSHAARVRMARQGRLFG